MASEQRVLIAFDDVVNALTKEYGKVMNTHIYSPREILESIGNIRRVDAVSVVRCKDCKHYSEDQYGCQCSLHSEKENEDYPAFAVQMLPNDFCSYGERREGE